MKRPRQGCTRKEKKIDNSTRSPTTLEELEKADSIPQDLKIEILLKLPAKSIVSVVSASKLFAPIIRRRDYINSFLTQSLTRPRFLFTLANRHSLLFLSSSPYDNALSSLTRTKCLIPRLGFELSHSVGGLILADNADSRLVICNPTTGQVLTLPKIRSRRKGISRFFGYDPIDYQYKVLCMTQLSAYHRNEKKRVAAEEHQVLTLGAGAPRSWRMIECSTPHCPTTDGVCINGILYYGACIGKGMKELMLVSFDVRSEKFGFIRLCEDVKMWRIFRLTLINYHGRVAIADNGHRRGYYLWILEDVEKHEWSKIHVLHEYFMGKKLCVTGTTRTDEIIFAPLYFGRPFYVTYYNVKGSSIRRVEIEGIEDHVYSNYGCLGDFCRVWTFSDHAENIMRL